MDRENPVRLHVAYGGLKELVGHDWATKHSTTQFCKAIILQNKNKCIKNVYVLLLDLYNLKTSKIKGIINLKPLANSTLVWYQ